ncbi:MAG: hypothetical protein DGJ47_001121 [Rickettsiaceae bacterium]
MDVSFADDINRSQTGNSAENLSITKRIALNLLKQDKSVKAGISAKRKKAGWDHAYLFKVISLLLFLCNCYDDVISKIIIEMQGARTKGFKKCA